jgi:hypothetical protein
MGSRFRHRNFGLSSRPPTRPRGQDAAPPAAPAGDMILAPRPRRRQQVPRMLFWLGALATIAAGVVYLIR